MRSILIAALCLFYGGLNGQKITATVSSDSILIGNTFKLTYKIENIDSEFEAPIFDESLTIVGGPNYSNSVQIMNGHQTSSQSISYYIKPIAEGQFFVPPVSIVDGNNILETVAIEINVYPNPDKYNYEY